jgi:hypothetical protein
MTQEGSFTERVSERPALTRSEAAKARPRDLGVRFVSGALTSVAAGLVTLVFGARAGGLLLGFPAILAASLTLIQEEEDTAHAREDARGAVLGACAMALFAGVAALTLGHIGAARALACAAAAWLVTAVGLYMLLWWK